MSGAPDTFDGLRRRLRELEDDLSTMTHRYDLAVRESVRLREWLRTIAVTCKGRGRDVARQAIHSSLWPESSSVPGKQEGA